MISFFIATMIILILNVVIHNFRTNCGKDINKINNKETLYERNNTNEEIEINREKEKEEINWYIEIPVISLKAPIQESVNMEVLNEFVGHFEETSKTVGNIGLAGHNRGYKNNYFENLNKLKKGDEVKYKYKEFEENYYIEKIETIKSTNWSYLDKSQNNRITLITCIENKPDLRLCVQAIQK